MRYQINPVPQKLAPRFHEISGLRSPRDGDVVPKIHYKTADNTKQLSQLVQCVQQLQRELYMQRRRSSAIPIQAGWQWQTPNKELDPTVAVASGIVVYISPENTLCTAGLTDLILATNVKAIPGVWISVQAVPAASGGNYNVPQIPPILGAPSGSPLSGDADNANVFWIQLWSYDYC